VDFRRMPLPRNLTALPSQSGEPLRFGYDHRCGQTTPGPPSTESAADVLVDDASERWFGIVEFIRYETRLDGRTQRW